MTPRFAPAAVVLATLGATAAAAQPVRTVAPPAAAPVIARVDAPASVDMPGIQWITVSRADLGVMRAALARPAGTGPFPVVVLFHGSHGWAREYVQLARALADSYYEAGDHNSLFRSLTQRDDELARMIAFFHQHLRD